MSPAVASLLAALIEAPEPLRSGAFHRLVGALWHTASDAAGRGVLTAQALPAAPLLVEALVQRRLPDPERGAFLLGLLAEAEREADPSTVGPLRACVRAGLPGVIALLREAAQEAGPLRPAREALLYLAAQFPEEADLLGPALGEAFGAESSAAQAVRGAFALASAQPQRARAIVAYLGAEAAHHAGHDREALLQRVLACPLCHGRVALTAEAIACASCGQRFAWQGDVPSLLRPADAAADQFPAARVAEYETGTRPRFVRLMSGDFDKVITPEREVAYLQQWLRPREGPVLDLACGAGGWTRAVAAVAGADRVLALDYSVSMLAAVGARVPRVTRVHGSASALPFGTGVFGAVNCSDALQALPDPAAALREVARILMPSAPFTCFTMLDAPAPYGYFQRRFPDHARSLFTVPELEAMVQQAGLALLDLVTVGSGVFFTARKPAA